MNISLALGRTKQEIARSAAIDIFAAAAMYFLPAAAHMLSFPLFLLEPIRLIIILALIHTNRNNALLLAVTLPLFSFLASGHPVFFKMLIITAEMSLNVIIFYAALKLVRNLFISMATAIVASKLFYYALEYLFLTAALIPSGLGEHPVLLQAGLIIILSLYTLIFFKEEQIKE